MGWKLFPIRPFTPKPDPSCVRPRFQNDRLPVGIEDKPWHSDWRARRGFYPPLVDHRGRRSPGSRAFAGRSRYTPFSGRRRGAQDVVAVVAGVGVLWKTTLGAGWSSRAGHDRSPLLLTMNHTRRSGHCQGWIISGHTLTMALDHEIADLRHHRAEQVEMSRPGGFSCRSVEFAGRYSSGTSFPLP